ncbi:tRNA-5-methyluridine(54) 2-sulfurtransferase [Nymphon striatum]|nr:tRNA-5-methyluridine(54) 2-sulfurtransferase [Nymphon striatum]
MAEESDGTFNELKSMVTDYAKQETVDPLKNLGKWAGLGVAGAVMMMIGGLLLGLGVLRLFQKINDKLLVAVSGGKDSLAIWHILHNLGYDVDGLYIGLGIGDYSEPSGQFAKTFADEHGLNLVVVDITEEYGYDIPNGSRAAKRAPCSACGMSKRHIFDRVAVEGGYDVLVTGHNLDDEAAVLFGNVLHWQTDYLARQHPVLPERNGLPRKVKPLVRLDEREMAAYCVITGIDYILDECPMAVGNKHIRYKDALNEIELASPGSKAAFFHKFLSQGAPFFQEAAEELRDGLNPCETCGQPTPNDVCAFCRLVERAGGQPVPVELTASPKVSGST